MRADAPLEPSDAAWRRFGHLALAAMERLAEADARELEETALRQACIRSEIVRELIATDRVPPFGVAILAPLGSDESVLVSQEGPMLEAMQRAQQSAFRAAARVLATDRARCDLMPPRAVAEAAHYAGGTSVEEIERQVIASRSQ